MCGAQLCCMNMSLRFRQNAFTKAELSVNIEKLCDTFLLLNHSLCLLWNARTSGVTKNGKWCPVWSMGEIETEPFLSGIYLWFLERTIWFYWISFISRVQSSSSPGASPWLSWWASQFGVVDGTACVLWLVWVPCTPSRILHRALTPDPGMRKISPKPICILMWCRRAKNNCIWIC